MGIGNSYSRTCEVVNHQSALSALNLSEVTGIVDNVCPGNNGQCLSNVILESNPNASLLIGIKLSCTQTSALPWW